MRDSHSMQRVIGLDVSTSITGVCILDASQEVFESVRDIVTLTHVDFKKCNSFWEKVDHIESELSNLDLSNISHVFIEEPMMSFASGQSSAQVIALLLKFNGLTSFMIRKLTSVEPTYVSAASARKASGVRVMRTSACGMCAKDQVFKHMSETQLKHITWPLKKSGEPKNFARDEVDAYVVARGGMALYK